MVSALELLLDLFAGRLYDFVLFISDFSYSLRATDYVGQLSGQFLGAQ